jgi:transcription elongation factor Elf1
MATPARTMTIGEFEAIRSDPNNKGKVFAVSRQVFEHYAEKLFIKPISDSERREISLLIKQDVKSSRYIGLTRTFSCPHCSHEFTFADHYRAALDMKVHSANELAKFTVGGEDAVSYLVVDTDKKRDVKCVSCGKIISAPHCCYTTSDYAYA